MIKIPKFIQASCIEGNKIDLRQANVVLKYKPDIVLFELPVGKTGSDTSFNKYSVYKKPQEKVDKIIKNLKMMTKEYPYAGSDIIVWENIKKLWGQGHNVYIYNVDSSDELRQRYFNSFNLKYPQVRKDWMFWVYLLIRELHMAENVQWVLNRYSEKENPVIAVFLQSIHWKHVKFLLQKPSKEEIWKYYFGRFKEITPKNIDQKIKERDEILYKYWPKNPNVFEE